MTPLRTFLLSILLCPIAAPAFAGTMADASLPFKAVVTEEKMDPPPEYMGPANRTPMDFPYSPVEIDGEYWIIYCNGYLGPLLRYKGTNIENAVRQPDGSRSFPVNAPYILGGMWYDKEAHKLYAPLHCEVWSYAGWPVREVHLASSTDKGLTWKYEGPLITHDDPVKKVHPTSEDSGLYWDDGDGDQQLFIDPPSGYAYLFTNHYNYSKPDGNSPALRRHCVARCLLSDKLASGKWKKFYNGKWDEPGIGGKGSFVNGYVVTYNTFAKRYLSFNDVGCICVCTDLAKQDWSDCIRLGTYWCRTQQWGIWATDGSKRSIWTSDKTIYVYNFWEASPGHRYRVDLSEGATPAALGFDSATAVLGMPDVSGADPSHLYAYTPFFESPDPIDARHTRRVGSNTPETHYGGTWKDENNGSLYEGRAKIATEAGASITFTFNGPEFYWRAVKGPELGKADVYLDGSLAATVDCWGATFEPFQFAFIKTGLAPGEHTAKIVVKGEKNPLSKGVGIEHSLFEYGAETYRASDCFCSVNGKNNWNYQERNGSDLSEMKFTDPRWKGAHGTELGYFHSISGAGDAVRKWTAPHAGSVRVEGSPTLEKPDQTSDAAILKNADQAWTAHLSASTKAASHDLTISVAKGDALIFITHNGSGAQPPAPTRVNWDPIVTYLP